jgi:hypothetical protein
MSETQNETRNETDDDAKDVTITHLRPLTPDRALASREEFERERGRWAQMIKGGAIPKVYGGRDRGTVDQTPEQCIAKARLGVALGFDPVVAVNLIHLIDGRPCLEAKALVALVRERLPIAKICKLSHDDQHCAVAGKRDPDDPWHECTFTLDDAARAGLTKKDNWQKYPRDMLWNRAVSRLCRELFSDVTLGLHTPEEIENAAPFTVRQMPVQPSAVMEGVGDED